MRNRLIDEMKQRIEETLKDFLLVEGLELRVASNDNIPGRDPAVELEAIDDIMFPGSKLLFEIRVALKLQGKPSQCDSLIRGMYYILHPHNLTISELSVLLMSIHVEELPCEQKKMQKMRAVLCYIIEGIVSETLDEPRMYFSVAEEC